MKETLRRHHISFRNAFSGLFWAFRVHPNFRIHLVFAILAIILGYALSISRVEMTIVALTIVLVFTAEMVNTAIESVTDLITREWRQEAKIAKDVSAGMTLVAALGAVAVGLIIFIPYLWRFF